MANIIDPLAGFTLKDVMSNEGIMFDFGEEFKNCDDEHYMYNPKVNMTDNELVKFMNLEIHDEGETGDSNRNETSSSLGFNFEKIKEKMVDLTLDGKIKKLVRQKGVGDVVPQESLVTIKYSGYFEGQDEPYDSSHLRGASDKYRLNQGNLIWGLDLAIQSMQKHEVSIFWIHYDYAYGELGCLPLIPPAAEVMFIVYLIDYLDNGIADTCEHLDPQQRHIFENVQKFTNHLLTSGANYFKRGQYRLAIRDYKRAGDHLEDAHLENEEEEAEMKRLISRTYQNLAICYNKENMPRLACIACSKVVHKTAKTYYHYGKALVKMGEYSQAMEQLNLGLKMSPNDKDLINQIKLTIQYHEKNLAIEKKMWKRCLEIDNLNKDCLEAEYHKIAREFCEDFRKNENMLRQPFPEGLKSEVVELIRKQALISGLNVTVHERFGNKVSYLEKVIYK